MSAKKEMSDNDENSNILFDKHLYSNLRKNVVNYLIIKGMNKEESLDIFHDALMIFLTKKLKKRPVEIHGITSYLIGVSKNIMLNIHRSRRNNSIDVDFLHKLLMTDNNNERHVKEQTIEKILITLEMLSEPCKVLLKAFYLDELSYEEICIMMDYKNIDTAKNKKYKCLKRLRKLVNESNFLR